MRFISSIFLSLVLIVSLTVWGVGFSVLSKVLNPVFINYAVDQAPFEDAGDYLFDAYGATLTRQGFPKESVANFKEVVMQDGVLIADARNQMKTNGMKMLEWFFSTTPPETLSIIFTTQVITATVVDKILVPVAKETGLPATREILQSLVERKIPPQISLFSSTDKATLSRLVDVRKGLIVFRVATFAAGTVAVACVLFLFLLERRSLSRWFTFMGLSFGFASLGVVATIVGVGQRVLAALQKIEIAPLGYDARGYVLSLLGYVQQQFWPIIGLFFFVCVACMVTAVIARNHRMRYTPSKGV